MIKVRFRVTIPTPKQVGHIKAVKGDTGIIKRRTTPYQNVYVSWRKTPIRVKSGDIEEI
jgi:hypothetical protein